MATASHRPDVCRRYHAHGAHRRPAAARYRRTYPQCLDRPAFYGHHTARWLTGKVAEWTTGYGTSLGRVMVTLALTWLVFAALYGQLGAVMDVSGQVVTDSALLGYSAAALTPIDAFPLEAANGVGRALAMLEGVLGLVLLGALGYVGLARLRT